MSPIYPFRIFFLLALAISNHLLAQTIDWKEDLSLEEFLNLKVAVASAGIELEQREAPGIVSILTAEQIRNMGVRDLAEVLAQIPGFQFSIDTYGYTALMARGNYTGDGKFLLMIDGIEINEFGYNSISLFHHFDLTQISKIEIIRGPGSARYGGAAELTVINIITQSPEELSGLEATLQNSTTAHTANSRSSLALSMGQKTGKVAWAAHASGIRAVLSDQPYTSTSGQTDLLTHRSDIRTTSLYLHLQVGNWRLALLQDDHITPLNSTGGVLFSQSYPSVYYSSRALAEYTHHLGEFWELKTGLQFGNSNAYSLLVGPAEADSAYLDFFTQNKVYRGTAFAHASYTHGKMFSFSAGIEHRSELARYLSYDGSVFPVYYIDDTTGKNNLLVHWESIFAQGLWKTKFGTITAGAQTTLHSRYGAAFAPRLAFTRSQNNHHFKVLAARAYRAPSTFNLVLSQTFDPNNPLPLRPEHAWTFEAEGGFKIGNSIYIQSNIYLLKQIDVILYDASSITLYSGYRNVGNGGTWGLEANAKLTRPWGTIEAMYAFYSAAGLNTIADYEVPGVTGALLAAAQHSAGLRGVLRLGQHFSASPSLLVYGPRYAISGYNMANDSTPYQHSPGEINRNIAQQYPTTAMLNLQLNFYKLLKNRCDIAFVAQNLLNTRQVLIPAYVAPETAFEGPMYLPRLQGTIKATIRLQP